ncbi:hypothetical protein JCM8097_002167 [Rhodosporidiobolus ruineniae]
MSTPSAAPRTVRRVPFPLAEDDSSFGSSSSALAQLPSDHFLAQRPVTPPRPESVIRPVTARDVAHWTDGARPDTSSLAAADYDVSVVTGFMPPEEPVRTLKGFGSGWDELEDSLEQVQTEAAAIPGGGVGKLSQQWRDSVRELPMASVELLTTLPLLRRAHTLLAHLAHFYVHGVFPSDTRVPAQLAVPLVAVSDRLGLPPILTYADTVLWAWKLTDKAKGLRADNVEITTMFTSTPSESAFFLLSLFCELHGPSILRLMSSTLDEAFFADAVALTRISSYLGSIALLIDELTQLMADSTGGNFGPDKREHIDPAAFYWEIRPWFNGGKWVYEGAGPDGEDQEMEWGGPSAGQSSLVHALDLFLGVDHAPRPSSSGTATPQFPNTFVERLSEERKAVGTPTPVPMNPFDKLAGKKLAPPPTATLHKSPSDATFMQRMSHYMPGHHRAFLQHLSSLHSLNPSAPRAPVLPSLRELAALHPVELGAAYDTAVKAMKRFRDVHIRLATFFIVSQARREPTRNSPHWAGWEARRVQKEREEEEKRLRGIAEEQKRDVIAGTGGTDLVTFLKRCRDRTAEAIMGEGQQ